MRVTDAQVDEACKTYNAERAGNDSDWLSMRAAPESLGGVWLSDDEASRAAAALRYAGNTKLADRIDAQMTPEPREPWARGAVVEDANGRIYMRARGTGIAQWASDEKEPGTDRFWYSWGAILNNGPVTVKYWGV